MARTTTGTATPTPILTPWLLDWDVGVGEGSTLGAIDALFDVSATSGVVRDELAFDVLDAFDVDVTEGVLVVLNVLVELAFRPIVVNGTPRSKVVTVGSAWQGWSRSCWQQKVSLVSESVIPLPMSTT